jgi:hypothetical protein
MLISLKNVLFFLFDMSAATTGTRSKRTSRRVETKKPIEIQ